MPTRFCDIPNMVIYICGNRRVDINEIIKKAVKLIGRDEFNL